MPPRRDDYRESLHHSNDDVDDYEPLQSIRNRPRPPSRSVPFPSSAGPSAAGSRPSAISISSSSSNSIPQAPGQAAAGPSRPAAGSLPPSPRRVRPRPNVDDDEARSSRYRLAGLRRRARQRLGDDEDVVYTGSSGAEDGPQAGPSRTRNRAPNHHIQRLNAALDARPRRDPNADRRQVLFQSPSLPPDLPTDSESEDELDPVPVRPRIPLGGAVFRRGGARRLYLTQPHAQNEMAAPGQHLMMGGHAGHFMLNAIGAGMGLHAFGGVAFGGAGPARAEADIEAILKSVEVPKYPAPTTGFVANFDMKAAQAREAIEIDDNGAAKKKQKQPILVCAKCKDPLLISEAYRTPADKVWALRCGHLIDQKCLDEIQAPRSIMEMARVDKHPDVLDEQPAKKRKGGRRPKVQERPADEYTWKCPVEGCGRQHLSKDVGGEWVMVEGEGALQVYA
ncbi:hypothetical protein IAR50_001575 [Cryptococcus sp. DSM 104548]